MRRRVLFVVTVAALAGGASCGDDGRELAEPPATTTTQPAAVADAGTTADLPTPIEAPERGATVWGVYLATGAAGDDPAVEDAVARADEEGLDVTVGEVSCDVGAPEALGLSPATFVVAVYFETEEEARAFLDAYGPPAVGLAKVQISCAN